MDAVADGRKGVVYNKNRPPDLERPEGDGISGGRHRNRQPKLTLHTA